MKIFNATKLTATIVLSVAIMFSACDNAKQQGTETQQQEQARQDSINKALEQMRQDSINKAIEQIKLDSIREDSIRRNRVTPDLALFELKGPVKSVNKGYIINGTENGASFDRDGNISHLNKSYNGYTYKFKRGQNGLIYKLTSYDPDADEQAYSKITYDNKNRPIKNEYYASYTGGSYSFSYTGDKISLVKFFGGSDYDIKSNYTYTYINFDKYGNWTKRKVSIKSTIYNWDNTVMLSDNNSKTQSRKITYYE